MYSVALLTFSAHGALTTSHENLNSQNAKSKWCRERGIQPWCLRRVLSWGWQLRWQASSTSGIRGTQASSCAFPFRRKRVCHSGASPHERYPTLGHREKSMLDSGCSLNGTNGTSTSQVWVVYFDLKPTSKGDQTRLTTDRRPLVLTPTSNPSAAVETPSETNRGFSNG